MDPPNKSASSACLEKKQLVEHDRDKQANPFLLCLSLVKNFEKLFNTKTASRDSIAIIHGIRLLSMNLVILGHTASKALETLAFRNAAELRTLRPALPAQIVANLTPVVDTFFMLSGLLVVYLCLKRMDEAGGKMNWWIFYFHRYWSALMLVVLLGMWPVDAAGGQIPVYAAALYGGFARSIWAACVAWIVIACVGGHGGFVTTLLSLKSLVPPSRLTFAAYLVHMIPINVFYASRQHSFDLSAGLVYYFYVGNLVLVYACALVVSLLFEAPILGLEKVLLAGRM
ncbi:uncharacterized protein LOC144139763 [Haemaphysalis longicornis]